MNMEFGSAGSLNLAPNNFALPTSFDNDCKFFMDQCIWLAAWGSNKIHPDEILVEEMLPNQIPRDSTYVLDEETQSPCSAGDYGFTDDGTMDSQGTAIFEPLFDEGSKDRSQQQLVRPKLNMTDEAEFCIQAKSPAGAGPMASKPRKVPYRTCRSTKLEKIAHAETFKPSDKKKKSAKSSDALKRNRLAASKSRSKRNLAINDLQNRFSELREKNKELHAEHETLLQQIFKVKNRILQHVECSDDNIQAWIAHEAESSVKFDHSS